MRTSALKQLGWTGGEDAGVTGRMRPELTDRAKLLLKCHQAAAATDGQFPRLLETTEGKGRVGSRQLRAETRL